MQSIINKILILSLLFLIQDCAFKKKLIIDKSRFNDLPYNFFGEIEDDTCSVQYNSMNIIGTFKKRRMGKHLELNIAFGEDTLKGKIKKHEKYMLTCGKDSIVGHVWDKRTMAAKRDGVLKYYARQFDLKIGNERLVGVVESNDIRILDIQMRLGNKLYSGNVKFAEDTLYYDIKIGTKLILGTRICDGNIYELYLAELNRTELISLILFEIIYNSCMPFRPQLILGG